MRRNNRIIVTRPDAERLRAILASGGSSVLDRDHLSELRDELERARIVAEAEISPDVVRLQSQVRVRDPDTGVSSDYTIVSPVLADVDAGRISVIAPLGTALLGYREGDEVEWQMPGGVRRFRIEKVSQPQRAGPHSRRRRATSAIVAA